MSNTLGAGCRLLYGLVRRLTSAVCRLAAEASTNDQGPTGQVAGAAPEKSGSKPITQKTACRACVLPEGPRPGQRTVGPPPDISLRAAVSCPKSASITALL